MAKTIKESIMTKIFDSYYKQSLLKMNVSSASSQNTNLRFAKFEIISIRWSCGIAEPELQVGINIIGPTCNK